MFNRLLGSSLRAVGDDSDAATGGVLINCGAASTFTGGGSRIRCANSCCGTGGYGAAQPAHSASANQTSWHRRNRMNQRAGQTPPAVIEKMRTEVKSIPAPRARRASKGPPSREKTGDLYNEASRVVKAKIDSAALLADGSSVDYEVADRTISSTNRRGAPMSTTCSFPTYCDASFVKKPGLAATNVQVCLARIVCRAAAPVSQSKPLGKSTARIGLPLAFIRSIASA